MNVKITRDLERNCVVNLPDGGSFNVEENELPESLRSGGEGIIMFFSSTSGKISSSSCEDVLNYLLKEDK